MARMTNRWLSRAALLSLLVVFAGLLGYAFGVSAGDGADGTGQEQAAAVDTNSLQSEPTDAAALSEPATTSTEAETTTTMSAAMSSTAELPEGHRRYELNGGAVVVSFEGDTPVIESTESAADFEVDTANDGDGTLEVNFRRADGAHSQLRVWYADGPQVILDDHGF